MREPIDVPRPEDETPAKLKRVLSQLVLVMAARARSFSRLGIFLSQEMQQVRGLQFRRAIGFAVFVDQKREGDAGFIAKSACVIGVP